MLSLDIKKYTWGMLERAAGCLEYGGLRRLLPGSKKTCKSRRLLHSGFWQHGAGDLVLPALWNAIVPEPEAVDDLDDGPAKETGPPVSNGLFLDFLYPVKTVNFLRQYSAQGVTRLEARKARSRRTNSSQRLYTTATEIRRPDANGVEDLSILASTSVETSNDTQVNFKRNALRRMLKSKKGDYEEAWRLFLQLDEHRQRFLQREVMDYMSTSTRIPDADRVCTLFSNIPMDRRGHRDYRLAIMAQLRLGHVETAIALHKEVISTRRAVSGTDVLIAYQLRHSAWLDALQTWQRAANISVHEKDSGLHFWQAVDSMSDLGEQAVALAQFTDQQLEQASRSADAETIGGLEAFATLVVKRALDPRKKSFNSDTFLGLLSTLNQWGADPPIFYNKTIAPLLDRGYGKLAVSCYRSFRRDHGGGLGRNTLTMILELFCKNNSLLGMQQVMDDWFKYFGRPNQQSYKLCLAVFARQGAVQTVNALFSQYLTAYGTGFGRQHVHHASEVSSLLQVHARRGEAHEVQRIFDSIPEVYGVKPDLFCWNILINAYGRTRNVDEAFRLFNVLLGSDTKVKPDNYTFGTMMGICAVHGDGDRVIALYQEAASRGIQRSTAMLDCLVLAKLQQGKLQEAERICRSTIHATLDAPATRMWNQLLVAHGMRRDLAKVNRLLAAMKERNIPYNSMTYAALMQSLAMIKQPDRAYAILKDVMPDAGMKATAFHYAVVMGGYIANGEIDKVYSVQNRMTKRKIKPNVSTQTILIKASAIDDQRDPDQNHSPSVLARADAVFDQALSEMDAQDFVDSPRKGLGRQAINVAGPAAYFEYLIFVYGTRRAFTKVAELYDQYVKVARNMAPAHTEGPPIRLLAALMSANLREGNIGDMVKCWELAFAQAKKYAHSIGEHDTSRPNWVLPVQQYTLAIPLSIYIRGLADSGKFDVISATFAEMTYAGFRLSNTNVNLHINLLSQHRQYRSAFEACETMLMDNWTGWSTLRHQRPEKNRLSPKIRAWKQLPDTLRPVYHTFLQLSRCLLDLRDSASESRQAQFLLDELEKKCPKTLKALRTMQRDDSDLERQIVRG